MRSRSRRWAAMGVGIVVVIAMAACGDDGEGGGDQGGASVDVTLQEFAVGAVPSTIDAGEVTFDVSNEGPDDVHEFVVIATDLGPTELPTNEDGTVDEEGEGIEIIGEIEEVAVGSTESLTLDLDPGDYVLICNIWEEDEQESHYQEGMRTSFTVN